MRFLGCCGWLRGNQTCWVEVGILSYMKELVSRQFGQALLLLAIVLILELCACGSGTLFRHSLSLCGG